MTGGMSIFKKDTLEKFSQSIVVIAGHISSDTLGLTLPASLQARAPAGLKFKQIRQQT